MDIIQHQFCNAERTAPSDMKDDCVTLPVCEYKDVYGQWQASFWRPSDEEMAILNAGGNICLHVRVGGRQHPVVAMGVEPVGAKPREDYQTRIGKWLVECFGNGIAYDRQERNWRFGEEALELIQAQGATKEQALQLVEYVYGRPEGEPQQEVGGVMVTLAALCLASQLDMAVCGEAELARINTPEMIEKIRTKNANKPLRSPLPGSAP